MSYVSTQVRHRIGKQRSFSHSAHMKVFDHRNVHSSVYRQDIGSYFCVLASISLTLAFNLLQEKQATLV